MLNLFEDKLRKMSDLLVARSLNIRTPDLSVKLLIFKLIDYSVLFTFNACPKNFAPSLPIILSPKSKLNKISFLIKNLAILLALKY